MGMKSVASGTLGIVGPENTSYQFAFTIAPCFRRVWLAIPTASTSWWHSADGPCQYFAILRPPIHAPGVASPQPFPNPRRATRRPHRSGETGHRRLAQAILLCALSGDQKIGAEEFWKLLHQRLFDQKPIGVIQLACIDRV